MGVIRGNQIAADHRYTKQVPGAIVVQSWPPPPPPPLPCVVFIVVECYLTMCSDCSLYLVKHTLISISVSLHPQISAWSFDTDATEKGHIISSLFGS